MKYRKIELKFSEAPERFNRTFYAKEGLTLLEFACVVTTILGATYEHTFEFTKDDQHYVTKGSMKDPLPNDNYLGDYLFTDLGSKFSYMYDFGDGWLFDVYVSDKTYELNNRKKVVDLKGIGKGIWEDNIYGLYQYLDGQAKPDTFRTEKTDFMFPWNIEIYQLKDWDKFTKNDANELLSFLDRDIKCFCGKTKSKKKVIKR